MCAEKPAIRLMRNGKRTGPFSETCGVSCQNKLNRKRLKEDPKRFASFQEKQSQNLARIWKERSPEENEEIRFKQVESFRRVTDRMTPAERRKRFSRYHLCDPETILRINNRGAEALMNARGGYVTTFKGKYVPKNIEKYAGNWKNVIHRSGWERSVMKYLDENPAILEWNSEETIIHYRDPFEGHMRRYFPDFWIKVQKPDGTVAVQIWEIKPEAQSKPPVLMESATPAQKRRHYLKMRTYVINSAKWKAAQEYCESRGWTFQVVTEKNLPSMGRKNKKK